MGITTDRNWSSVLPSHKKQGWEPISSALFSARPSHTSLYLCISFNILFILLQGSASRYRIYRHKATCIWASNSKIPCPCATGQAGSRIQINGMIMKSERNIKMGSDVWKEKASASGGGGRAVVEVRRCSCGMVVARQFNKVYQAIPSLHHYILDCLH